jgi:hypothetical protein
MNGLSWSAPGANPGLDPAARMSQFRFGGGGSPHLGNAGQNQLGSATQSALSDVAKIMQQWKNDKIANALLDQHADDPLVQKVRATGASGSQAFQIYQTLQNEGQQGEQVRLKNQLTQAQIDKLNQPDDSVDTPYGKMTPYQWGQIANKPGDSSAQDWKKAIPIARGKLDDQGNFTNQYTGAETGPYVKLQVPNQKNQIVVPWDAYQGKVGTAQPQQNTQPAQQQDQFVKGKQYKDAQGNTATYLGNGQWSQ